MRANIMKNQGQQENNIDELKSEILVQQGIIKDFLADKLMK